MLRILSPALVIVTILLTPFLSQAQKPCGHISQIFNQHTENQAQADENLDITHYNIELNITDFVSKRISGNATVTFKALTNPTSSIELSLEGLTVDSIKRAGSILNYTHIENVLKIDLPQPVSNQNTDSVMIYYGGTPIRDASWGGFYFSGNYAFNLGVAFTSNPHNYGRVWFPCLDLFTDRATYSFEVTCTDDKVAMCNGLLQKIETHGNDTRTFHWEMKQEIPTYLAAVAVAPYTLNESTHKNIPITLAALEADSANMSATFINLNKCIDAFLSGYGPHTFDRIGFNIVPFNGGAMEHATNIAYPKFGAQGDLAYETLYAHELAHHWWGNTVTCSDAKDMWLNEGWASFSERLFLEWVYGKEDYQEDVSSNHKAVLHYAHLRDGDTLPVSGIGHENTYGMHVYDKGADMVHTLRGIMGDSAFFRASRSFLVDYHFQAVSSEDLKSHFQKFTNQDLDAFFTHWIYGRGFPHFDIISWETSENPNQAGTYDTKLRIRQRTRFAKEYFEGVKMEVTSMSSDFKMGTDTFVFGGYLTDIELTTPYLPTYFGLDIDQKISDAITDKYAVISQVGDYNFGDAMMEVDVKSIQDSAFLRVEHHWVGADAYYNPASIPVISPERYWSVDGVNIENVTASATIEYNGRAIGTNYAAGYLDNGLIRITEDSVVLMYRPNSFSKWEIHTDNSKTMGSPFDKRGTFTINNLQKGEYAFGMFDHSLLSNRDIVHEEFDANKLIVYPNPSSGELQITFDEYIEGILEITDNTGKVIFAHDVRKTSKLDLKIDTTAWAKGAYYLGLSVNNQTYIPKRVIVR